jgi:prophage regulatory protein
MLDPLLREPQVTAATGKSRSSLWLEIKGGLFVPGVKIGRRSIRWPQSEVARIIRARIAGQSDGEIKALVAELVTARKQFR